MKTCSTCKTDKPLNEFHNSLKLAKGLSVRCKVCANKATRLSYNENNSWNLIKSREYRANNPDAGRNAKFKYKYGISLNDYNEILERQGFTCAICQVLYSPKYKLDVDHNHVTGKVRGLLCRSCNLAIGQLKDSPIILSRAAAYLQTEESTLDQCLAEIYQKL